MEAVTDFSSFFEIQNLSIIYQEEVITMFEFKMLKRVRIGLGSFVVAMGPLFAHGEGQSIFNSDEVARRIGQGKPSVGVMLGVANAAGSYENGLNYGIETSFQFTVPYSAMIELSGYSAGRSTADAGLTRTMLLGKVMYNFSGTTPVIRYSYAGAGLGPVYDNVGGDQKWNLGLAPQAGFDIPVGNAASKFSLGANVALLLVTGGSPSSVAANGVAKYWF